MQQLRHLPLLLVVQTKEQEALDLKGTIDQEKETRKVVIILTYLVLRMQMETVPITPERDQISQCLLKGFCFSFILFTRFQLLLLWMLPSKLNVEAIWRTTGIAGRFYFNVAWK